MTDKYIFTIKYNKELHEVTGNHPDEIAGYIYEKFKDGYPVFEVLEAKENIPTPPDLGGRDVFECIGYMKNKLPGESPFSMFVNENSYGSMGGFKWEFQDFCPDHPHEYGRLFIHTMSYDEIKRKIIHDLEMKRIYNG